MAVITLNTKAIYMQSKRKLEDFFKELDFHPDTGKIALRTLSNTLSSNERVLDIIQAGSESTVGVLVATEMRVLYVGCSPLRDSIIKTFGYCDIVSIERKDTEFPSTEIEICCSTGSFSAVGCPIDKSKKFVRTVNEIMEDRKSRSRDMDEIL